MGSAAAELAQQGDLLDNYRRMEELASGTVNMLMQSVQVTQTMVANQQAINQSVREGESAAGRMLGKVSGFIGKYATWDTAGKILQLADGVTQTTAKLSAMNQVMGGGSQNAEKLQQMVFQCAQSTGAAYGQVAQTVASLGTLAKNSFGNTDEVVRFTDLMSKGLSLGGTPEKDKAKAMEDMTKGMASGSFDSDGMNSMMKQAPVLGQAIEDYMVNVQGAQGSMKEWAAQGKITADVVKAALVGAGEDIDQKFAEMPMTWEQTFNMLKNTALNAFTPLLEMLSGITQKEGFQEFIKGIGDALHVIGAIAEPALGFLIDGAMLICDNWSILEPVLLGAAAAVLVFTIATQGSEIASKAAKEASRIWTAVQGVFNAVMAMNPIFIIILAIIALIAIIFAVVAAINKVTGSSYSATGVIAGAFLWMASVIGNLLFGILEIALGIINKMINPFILFGNFLKNLFKDPVSAIIYLFQGLADTVLGFLEKIASALDFVMGTDMAATVQLWRGGLKEMADNAVKDRGYDPGEFETGMLDLGAEDFGLKRFDNTEAFEKGYHAGEGLENDLKAFNASDLFGAAEEGGGLNGALSGDGSGAEEANEHLGTIADNTGRSADSAEGSVEDLKYMRDIAEREIIDRTVFSSINVSMGGITNTVQNMADLDGIGQYLAENINEQMAISAEGVN